MYKQCKTEQSAQRQRQLELGLMQTMLTKRYETLSVSDLCNQLQLPRKSFYRYFSSKEGCLYSLLDHTMMEFFDAGIASPSMDAPLADMRHFFLFWYNQRPLLDALTRNGLCGLLVERAIALAKQERLMPRYIHAWSPEPQQLAISFAICGLMSMVLQWHAQGFRTPTEEITRIAMAMLTKPLLPTTR